MFYQIIICIGGKIVSDPLQTVKQVSGIDLDEAIDAYVTYVSIFVGQPIVNITVFLDLLPARAMVELVADLDCYKRPLRASYLKLLRDGKRKDVRS